MVGGRTVRHYARSCTGRRLPKVRYPTAGRRLRPLNVVRPAPIQFRNLLSRQLELARPRLRGTMSAAG
jgi:hypothetical protein